MIHRGWGCQVKALLSDNSLKSFKITLLLVSALIDFSLLGCAGIKGLATGGGNGEDGSQQGGALDDIAHNDTEGGLSGLGAGGGGLPGMGGGMTGSPATGAPPGAGDGPSDPFDHVGGGGTNNTPGGSGSECSGGVCSTDTPSDVLFGKFIIEATLNPDLETPEGNCNTLFPPMIDKKVCERSEAATKPGTGFALSQLWMRQAWALPRNNNNGELGELVCSVIPVQPPIDSALLPKVEIKADRPFYSQSNDIYQKTFSAQCGADGKWLARSEVIKVPFSPSGANSNSWNFQVTALYPKAGTWEVRGSKNLTMNCAWNQDPNVFGVKCEPQSSIQMLEIQDIPRKEKLSK